MVDLTYYENLYDTFDGGHNRDHLERVRQAAVTLAKIYLPDKIELTYVAATLHDIGLSVERKGHEKHGADIISQDKKLVDYFSPEDFSSIVEAVREHRASSGNPQSVLAKIVSDADKCSDDSSQALRRAYQWGIKNSPEFDEEKQIIRAGKHLVEKFGHGGIGRRLYFKESEEMMDETYSPIISAVNEEDWSALRNLLTTT
jgi:uncharacterized protein